MKRILLITSLSFLSFITSYAQEVIRGIVKDETGQTLPGATILIKNTGVGIAVDTNGEFNIQNSKKDFPLTLIVKFLGYKEQEVEVYEFTEEILEVSLKLDNVLNEVVVIGYGKQKRADFTGSISSVSVERLTEIPLTSFDKALQGQVPGVQVTQSTGQPGGAVNIKIRGGNSITGGTEPLYVVDGFPIYNNNSDANAGALINGNSSLQLNALSFLNPGDIESLSVLKDASATAIYGSRGANGVVIITTKKGKAGETSVSYNGFYGVQQVTRTLPLLDAQQWARLKNDALQSHVGTPSPNSHVFTEAEIAAFGKGTDWQAEAYRDAPTQNHQITILGGSDKTRFGISTSYTNQQGIALNTGFKRFSGRINLESEISAKFKTGVNINASSSATNVLPGDVTAALLFIPPTVSLRDAKGAYTLKSPYESAVANPIATLTSVNNKSDLNRILGSLYGEYEIINGLNAKVLFGADLLQNKQNSYIPSSLFEGLAAHGIASVGTQSGKSWLNENTLSYSSNIGLNNINVLAGYTQQAYSSESVLAGSQSFINDVTAYNNLGSGGFYSKPGSDYYAWSLQSYLGRVSYNYDQKYYATLTIRSDGSSRFGAKNRWGNFLSGSLAWSLTKENFIKSIDFIDNLKLRLSAGTTGNQEIGQYQALATLSTSQAVIGNASQVGYAPNRIANPNLGWEKTYQYDIGLDADLFDNKISLVFDAYYKRTSNLLLDFPVPYSTGFEKALKNTGEVENKGIELGLNTVNLKDTKLTWRSTLLFSLNRNKVVSIGGSRDRYFPAVQEGFQPVIVKIGEPLGTFYSYVTDGIFKSTDDILITPRIDQANTKPGDQKYKDLDGDGKITQAGDRRITGNSQPKFLFGFTNTFAYKNFDLSVLFQGSYGNKIYSQIKQYLLLTTGFQNSLDEVANRWAPENENGTVPRANENVPTIPVSDRFLEDGSYIRLKTITIGYNLPKNLLSKVKIKNVRIYASALNTVTWTKYDGYDPEVNYYRNSTAQGIDYSTYPNAKSFIGGVSITF